MCGGLSDAFLREDTVFGQFLPITYNGEIFALKESREEIYPRITSGFFERFSIRSEDEPCGLFSARASE